MLATILFFIAANFFAQGFSVKASGLQTFSFEDESGRNQATFHSTTPLEDVTGTATDISGTVTFDVNDFSTLKGTIIVKVASFKTGIDLRDHHLRSANWLDAEAYPDIAFEIKNVSNIKKIADNKLTADVTGDFSVHGVTKEVTAEAEVQYLDESEATRKRAPGDLLGVQAKFNITLSDYNVENAVIGSKVAENIEITVNIVGSNAK